MDERSILEIPEHQLTPGMRQYKEAKEQNPDCIVLLRMGDFFELFYEDAVIGARELEITLTARGKGEKRAPLAGIPYHALDNYLGKLVKKGYKVAIVEQLEDPKKAKGLVKRGCVRIVTPGTIIESSMLNEKENNYLMSLFMFGTQAAAAFCDMSTGEFVVQPIKSTAHLIAEVMRLNPTECIIPESLAINEDLISTIKDKGVFVNTLQDKFFNEKNATQAIQIHFNTQSLDHFNLQSKLEVSVAGGLLHYLTTTQKTSLSHIKRIKVQNNTELMILDASTLRNLELSNNIKDNTNRGTLLSVLDKTVTAMGSRLLKKWIKQPLLKKEKIQQRQQAINALNQNIINRNEIILLLKEVYDLERLISRVNYGNANPRDLLALKKSLQQLPTLKEKLQHFQSDLLESIANLPDTEDITKLIQEAIKEDPPITIREGKFIKSEYNEELKELHDITTNAKQFLQNLEETEKQKTGITAMKIGFNKVFGYFIEVTKKNTHLVPEHYIRKQTTANAERYITEELKIQEEKILGAQEKINTLEYDLFQEVLKKVALKTKEIQETASKLAVLDVLCSLSTVALNNNYVMPKFVDDKILHIKSGRHPVVETLQSQFIPNDIILDNNEMMLITGPNMSGKSTVMRQTAIIVLMAQIGSFVPADECTLGVFDRIFTRVGAYDDLSSGQSTFMVEMTETASILTNATEDSLIILDEIGRGTSTFDGVSIAWSVAEYIYNKVKAKTLFATHYHVLNKLGERFASIKNFNIAVKEDRGDVTFLYKLIEGGTDKSYGAHVAKLAGLPNEVVERATQIQKILEKEDEMVKKIKAKKIQEQMSLDGF